MRAALSNWVPHVSRPWKPLSLRVPGCAAIIRAVRKMMIKTVCRTLAVRRIHEHDYSAGSNWPDGRRWCLAWLGGCRWLFLARRPEVPLRRRNDGDRNDGRRDPGRYEQLHEPLRSAQGNISYCRVDRERNLHSVPARFCGPGRRAAGSRFEHVYASQSTSRDNVYEF